MTDYGTALLSSGATAHRITQNIERMAHAYGVAAECSVLPSRIVLTLWDEGRNHSYSNVSRNRTTGINICVNTSLEQLCHEVETSGLSTKEATQRLNEILARRRMSPWIVTPLVGLANAAFCRLFGGDAASMLIVFIATVEGFMLKTKMLSMHFDARITTLASATVTAIIATSGYVFDWGQTPELALGTSVLFLVPGIPYINSVTDLLTGHHLSAVSRFIDAVVTTICLAIGLCLAMLLTQINYI